MSNSIVEYDEMINYLIDELKEEREKYLSGKDNHYGYIYMICNDLGIVIEEGS